MIGLLKFKLSLSIDALVAPAGVMFYHLGTIVVFIHLSCVQSPLKPTPKPI